MIDRIKQFFCAPMDPAEGSAGDTERRLRLATAALLLEVTRADFSIDAEERAAVVELLQRQFQLTEEELTTLVALAEAELQESISLYQFTRLINDNYSEQQKIALIECMWRVAFADGVLDKYEDHLIRTIADLIYVPHAQFIRTKLRVQAQRSS